MEGLRGRGRGVRLADGVGGEGGGGCLVTCPHGKGEGCWKCLEAEYHATMSDYKAKLKSIPGAPTPYDPAPLKRLGFKLMTLAEVRAWLANPYREDYEGHIILCE